MESDRNSPLLKINSLDDIPTTDISSAEKFKNKYVADKRRWYLWLVIVVVGMMSNMLGTTWPPIQETCQLVFGWTDENTLVIGLISSVTLVVFIIPCSWILNRKGLRFAFLFSVAFQALAATILIFPVADRYKATMVYISTFILGTSISICQSTGFVVFVASWFPPSERTAVTVSTFLLSDLGIAFSYVSGPYIVPDVGHYHKGHKIDINVLRKNTSSEHISFLRDRIRDYMYLESAITTALLICIFIYFPDKPPKPPCASCASQRLDFLQGIKSLLKNRDFFVLLVVYCLSNGVQWGWLMVMDVVLAGVGIDEKVVGWIGFGMRFFVFPALFASSFANRFRRYIKPALAFLFVGAACFQTVYSLACNQVIPLTEVILFATAFLHNMFFCANEPLLQDLAAESAFPVAEAISSGVMYMAANIVQMVFFLTFTFLVDKSNNPLWMNWVLAAVEVVCVPIVFMYSGRRRRLDVDLYKGRDKKVENGSID